MSLATLAATLWVAISPQIRVVQNVAYDDRSPQQALDLYVPTNVARFATLMFVHGGSLTSGDKLEDSLPQICRNVVSAGIGCASVNYRLGPAVKWPAQPDDVAAAVAWMRRHIAEYNGDSTALVLWGHSSGCAITAAIATDARHLARYGLSPSALAGAIPMGCVLGTVMPAITDSTRLRAVFTSGGLSTYGSLEAFIDADPSSRAGPHVPPLLILIAEAEQIQPPILEHARILADRLRAHGRTAEIAVLPGRRHYTALRLMADPGDPTLTRVIEFVRAVTAPESR